jgi:hypothetical protein
LLAVLTGCPKKPDATADAGAAVDAGAVAVDASVDTTTPDAASPTATAVTAATPHGCPAGKTAFVVDGKPACEIECGDKGKSNECTLPQVCIGKSPLAHAEAGAAPSFYCRTPPSGACPATNQAQFWGAGGKGVCETLCSKDNDPVCTAPATCKGSGQLLAVDGKMGEPHRYCRK